MFTIQTLKHVPPFHILPHQTKRIDTDIQAEIFCCLGEFPGVPLTINEIARGAGYSVFIPLEAQGDHDAWREFDALSDALAELVAEGRVLRYQVLECLGLDRAPFVCYAFADARHAHQLTMFRNWKAYAYNPARLESLRTGGNGARDNG